MKCRGCGSTSRMSTTSEGKKRRRKERRETTEVPQTSDIYRSETHCTTLHTSTTTRQEHVTRIGYGKVGQPHARARGDRFWKQLCADSCATASCADGNTVSSHIDTPRPHPRHAPPHTRRGARRKGDGGGGGGGGGCQGAVRHGARSVSTSVTCLQAAIIIPSAHVHAERLRSFGARAQSSISSGWSGALVHTHESWFQAPPT